MPRFTCFGTVAAVAMVVTAAYSDSTSPDAVALAAVTPAPAAINVATSTPITLTFSHPMMSGMTQFMDLHQGGITGPVVSMTCSWNGDLTVLRARRRVPSPPRRSTPFMSVPA